jgi:acyl-CoA synthetase (AMP-forming)/AMP-acid ligase II
VQPDDEVKPETVGKPLPGTEIRITEDQEVLVRSKSNFVGYFQNPEATAESLKDGWFHTGDMVRQDEEGYLYVVDRIKNMFISGGENVYPVEVERVILQHPAVSEAAVVGVPDERWGEVGKAYVVKKGALTESEVTEHCKARLARFKAPRHVVFVEELPKNDAGKIDRKELRGRG